MNITNVFITNPPYLSSSNMDKTLKEYLKKEYPISKSDLCTVFIERGIVFSKVNGFNSMVTMQSWMYLKSFENFRKKLFEKIYISNVLHMNNMVMGIAFGTAVSNLRKNELTEYVGNYNYIKYDDIIDNKPFEFPVKKNRNNHQSSNTFKNIPGMPIVYWADDVIINNFNKGISVKDISKFTGSQNKTANNKKYLRYLWEVSNKDIGIKKKWVLYSKGGEYRKYYGNLYLVVDWSEEARDFYKNNKTSNLLNEEYWFKEGITYSGITTKGASFRYMPPGCVFDIGGPAICYLNKYLYYVLGLFNSQITQTYLNILNPTVNLQTKDVNNVPILFDEENFEFINKLVKSNITICKNDWDEQETSITFKKPQLLQYNKKSIENNYEIYKENKNSQIKQYINNQTKLNEIFSKLYNLNHINFTNENKNFLIKPNIKNMITQLISYIIGCIFGRYNPFEEGLVYAGGKFNLDNYSNFIPDDDNIVPVLDTEYFEDDIVNRIIEFIKIVYGEETLEENIAFIANELDIKGNSNREKIRKYLLKNFYDDHVKTYKKHPIYWQFDSGKENAFKCLIYMHRYTPDTLTRIRTDYLHKTRKAIEEQIKTYDKIMENTKNKTEIRTVKKDKTKLIKQIDEIKLYDLALAHIANQKIEINLDDGVKINYEKFQNIEVTDPRTNKKKKINLLKKI